jgi:ribosomal protein S18 acetylase RimI-like enzyme
MPDSPVIRLYRPADRQAIRTICSDTADLSQPLENFFSDREVFADAMMNYYTDGEPQSLWVADYQGQAIGYVAGCLDTRRHMRSAITKILPGVFIRALARGVFWHRDSWNLIRCMIKSAQLGGFHRRDVSVLYPANLHINLEAGFRGQGLGRRLVEQFFAQARSAGCPGVQVSTSRDNKSACNFFEHLGFIVLGRYPMARPLKNGFVLSHTVIYGKKF